MSGMDAWVASVKGAMDNDPGIKLLEDQIQTFVSSSWMTILTIFWLDLSKIELVKTPSRRKHAPKRTRAAVAAAARVQSAVTVSLEDNAKEDAAPVNRFQQALVDAENDDDEHDTHRFPRRQSHQSTAPTVVPSIKIQNKQKSVKIAATPEPPEREEQFIEITSSSPQPHIPDSEEPADDLDAPPAALLLPRSDGVNELSMIAEDDEPAERSRASVPLPRLSPSPEHHAVSPVRASSPPPVIMLDMRESDEEDDPSVFQDAQMDQDDLTTATAITVSDSTHTYHSFAPPSPSGTRLTTSRSHDRLTEPLPKVSLLEGSSRSKLHSAPLPSIPSTSTLFPSKSDMSIPIRDHDSLENGLQHKLSLNLFPSIPAPSPLRKSMRGIGDASAGGGLGVRTPGLAPGGKRSSWLTKAREAKAMEGVSKRISAVSGGAHAGTGMGVPGLSGGVKRKSSDLFGGPVLHLSGTTNGDDGERRAKVAKISVDTMEVISLPTNESDVAEHVSASKALEGAEPPTVQQAFADNAPAQLSDEFTTILSDEQDGVLNRFKKTVEGLGARVGKSMGKSLGGAAASELAEARAAAEARVAERHKGEIDETTAAPLPKAASTPPVAPAIKEKKAFSPPQPPKPEQKEGTSSAKPRPPVFSLESERRLSVSDLVSKYGGKNQVKEPEPFPWPSSPLGSFKTAFKPTKGKGHVADASNSTTPPDSPPPRSKGFVIPGGPVFSKPPQGSSDFSFKLPPSTTFALHTPFSVGLQPSSKLSASPPRAPGLSAHPTQTSLFSDAVFDSQKDIPAWVPTTQDTDYTQESQFESKQSHINDLDEDDSWPLSEKLAPASNFAATEDSMTWSTLPTESQGADSGLPVFSQSEFPNAPPPQPEPTNMSHPFDMDVGELNEQAMAVDSEEELEDIAATGKSTISLVEAKQGGLEIGFFGQATKLVSSMLGAGKKGKHEPPKSIQRAAAAAKKHQEEQDRRAVRLREMESRRQAALQRKAEEERAQAEEEEKKLKDEAERRKKEREEHTGKRLLKPTEKKADEDGAKKRKVFVEIEKKPEVKKPPSKEKKELAQSRITKPSLNPSSSQARPKSAMKQHSASVMNPTATMTSAKGKGKVKATREEDDLEQPSKVIQSQMASRMKAQVQASKPPETPAPPIASELIELPEPNSEYSDSEDENRPRNFDPPEWAQSPELRQALESQRTVNPDDIFGAIRPLRMEDMFRTRQSRFRARTSSANWSGVDGLTEEEDREYARRMGFR
ncbi:hypothetical protein EW146_g21 [Bondarzewia mesenterica]|uniref:Inner centromere protein ARK-binding domain-containing protein n=1 Tax=Bondarzewia mesenterica TaxID=1095465 RepID=A0A4S4M8R5_9AGAM|nr:hypothetical protein EW146_g21 [Bondarzewia mesenterica]